MKLKTHIVGSWRGTYSYDAPAMQQSAPAGVGFGLHLTQTRWQRVWGRFAGSVTDDAPFGVPDEGKIVGKLAGNGLRFTKRLPELHMAGQDGPVSLHDFLATQDFQLKRHIAHPPIYYEGCVDADGCIKGTWKMDAAMLRLDAKGSKFSIPGSTGTFHMRKLQDMTPPMDGRVVR